MKILWILLFTLIFAGCGNKKSDSGSSNTISTDPLHASTVEGYLSPNGILLINGTQYQMVSSLSYSTIQQQLVSSNAQLTPVNGVSGYRAHITGYLYNPCQQNTGLNGSAQSGCNGMAMQSNMFYVSAISFY